MQKIILTILSFIIFSNFAHSQFSGGAGTEADPYRITSKEDMEALADSVNNSPFFIIWSYNKYFIVMNDITEPVTQRIGYRENNYFAGHFNGNNYTITLNLDYNGQVDVGLFGHLGSQVIGSIPTITNVVIDGYVKGHATTGGIAGQMRYSTISNCINNAKIEGQSSYTGGIAGRTYNSVIFNCINNAEVSVSTARVGGIVGDALNTTIYNCINIGTIKGYIAAGGITGDFGDYAPPYSAISNCINAGFIKGYTSIGGITGTKYTENIIKNCINTGVVDGTIKIGAIIGDADSRYLDIENNFYDKQMCVYGGVGGNDIEGAKGRLTKELIGTNLQAILGNEDWTYSTNLYPMLKELKDEIASKVAASPAYLDDVNSDYDAHNNVRECFYINTENGVQWTKAFDKIKFAEGWNTVYLQELGEDTIYASIANYKKTIPINVTKLCQEEQKIDTSTFPINLGKIHRCSDTTFRFGYIIDNQTNPDGKCETDATPFDGTDKDLFKYITDPPLPKTLSNKEVVDFYITFSSSSLLGIKTAHFYITFIDEDGKVKITKMLFTAEVVEGITADPNPLDFGDIMTNQTYYENIKLENTASQPAKIKRGYLAKNTAFTLETYLNNAVINGLDSLIAGVSVYSNVVGEITDTLIVITEYKYCDDTLRVPIRANVGNDLPVDTLYRSFGKIHRCSDRDLRFEFINGTEHPITYNLTNIEGTDKDLFSCFTNYVVPVTLNYNDTFRMRITFDPMGTTPGIKTAFLYLTKVNENRVTLYIFTAEVVEGITADPNPLDFGDITVNQTYYENIKLENTASQLAKIKRGYLAKNTDFTLETALDGAIINGLDSLIASVSVNSNFVGEITDTLIVITEYKYCDDTLRVPIRATVEEETIDTTKWHVPGDFGKQFKCIDTTMIMSLRFVYASTSPIRTILFATDMEGPDKDLFSYVFSKPLPFDLYLYDTLRFYVTFNSTGATLGIKTAYFYIHYFDYFEQKNKVYLVELTAEVVEGITADPNPLDFGDIMANQTYYENIKLENTASQPAKIKRGYLAKNTDFTLETDLDGAIINGLDSLIASVSVNSNTEGEITDTLIVITEYKYCDDTLRVPIRANVNIPIKDIKFTIRASENKNILPTRRNYRIPIYITADNNISVQSLTIKQLILTINRNLFHPKSCSNGDVSYHYDNDTINIRIENISVPMMNAGEETLLLNLVGDMLLANTDSSDIHLIDTGIIITWSNEEPELIDGCITINICKEGEDRFLTLYDEKPGVFMLENPVTEIFKIKCICYERGYHYIEILNILGQTFVPLHPNNGWFVNPKVDTDFYFDVEIPHYLNNGFYFIVMHGPTKSYYDSFILAK